MATTAGHSVTLGHREEMLKNLLKNWWSSK